MLALKKIGNAAAAVLLVMLALMQGAYASEIDLKVPSLDVGYNIWGYAITGSQILMYGIGICVLGMVFGFYEFVRIKKMPAHESMLKISNLIYETCKTYMKQQAKLLLLLEIFIAACIFYYFFYLNATPLPKVLTILGWSILGILGSFAVAWFGMRINTYANSRTAFLSLRANPYSVMSLPLRSGMSIGVLLICVELIMMIIILLFVPRESAGACFIGFAIGESLGASALRICGGIFTKIADIGADLMKIIFKIDEDDARNPGVIADCTGDNAGDSVGPTADGFETYGVTGVALISFIVLAAGMMYAPNGELTQMAGGIDIQARLIVWIFTMRVLMIITSVVSYLLNNGICKAVFGKAKAFNFETPLTSLVWLTSLISILVTFGVSYVMIGDMGEDLWWKLSVIISCGTFAAAIIPEFTKIFTSSKSKHVQEIVNASREAGASLNIISGIVAGNFSAFWKGLVMVGLMVIAFFAAQNFDCAVSDNLIGVHVQAGAGAALDGVDDELVMELAVDDFVAGGDDGVGDLGIQSAGMLVGHGRSLLDLSQADDQQLMHGMAGDGEVLMAAQGLDAIVSVNRHFQGTDGIGFDSCVHKKDPHFIHWPPERLFFSGTRIHDLSPGVKGGKKIRKKSKKLVPGLHFAKQNKNETLFY